MDWPINASSLSSSSQYPPLNSLADFAFSSSSNQHVPGLSSKSTTSSSAIQSHEEVDQKSPRGRFDHELSRGYDGNAVSSDNPLCGSEDILSFDQYLDINFNQQHAQIPLSSGKYLYPENYYKQRPINLPNQPLLTSFNNSSDLKNGNDISKSFISETKEILPVSLERNNFMQPTDINRTSDTKKQLKSLTDESFVEENALHDTNFIYRPQYSQRSQPVPKTFEYSPKFNTADVGPNFNANVNLNSGSSKNYLNKTSSSHQEESPDPFDIASFRNQETPGSSEVGFGFDVNVTNHEGHMLHTGNTDQQRVIGEHSNEDIASKSKTNSTRDHCENVSTPAVEGKETPVKKGQKRKPRTYSQAVPSQHCHICSRRPTRQSPHAVCGNLIRGRCRKTVCIKCFHTYNWDLKEATEGKPGSWECPHCRGSCPPRAQCVIYNRTSDRRRMKLINHRKRKTVGGAAQEAGTANKKRDTKPEQQLNSNDEKIQEKKFTTFRQLDNTPSHEKEFCIDAKGDVPPSNFGTNNYVNVNSSGESTVSPPILNVETGYHNGTTKLNELSKLQNGGNQSNMLFSSPSVETFPVTPSKESMPCEIIPEDGHSL